MKKNTRLLAVLLALTILALSLTACASSSKYVAETTTATVSNSAAYDSAPMEEPASTTQETAEFEEMKSENGALSMTTEVTQDDAPRGRFGRRCLQDHLLGRPLRPDDRL